MWMAMLSLSYTLASYSPAIIFFYFWLFKLPEIQEILIHHLLIEYKQMTKLLISPMYSISLHCHNILIKSRHSLVQSFSLSSLLSIQKAAWVLVDTASTTERNRRILLLLYIINLSWSPQRYKVCKSLYEDDNKYWALTGNNRASNNMIVSFSYQHQKCIEEYANCTLR